METVKFKIGLVLLCVAGSAGMGALFCAAGAALWVGTLVAVIVLTGAIGLCLIGGEL